MLSIKPDDIDFANKLHCEKINNGLQNSVLLS